MNSESNKKLGNGRVLLLVTGILYIVLGFFGLLGSFLLDTVGQMFGLRTGFWTIVSVILSAYAILLGIIGIVQRNKISMGSILVKLSMVYLILSIISVLITALVTRSFLTISAVVSVVFWAIPICYIIGAYKNLEQHSGNTKGLNSGKYYMQRHWVLYAMLILPLAYFFIFSYIPMVNILLAWSPNNVILSVWETPWVGWANFERAFQLQPFRDAIRNTLMFSALDLALGFPAPIILALLLNELKFPRFKKITQTISYMPFFLSWIIIGGMATTLFSQNTGAVNNIIYDLGGTPIPFLTNSTHWVFTNVFLAIWRTVGWSTIIYLAAITGINPELYEAADIDGASRIQKMWHVTIPGIRPVMVVLLILTLGGIMSADLARFIALDNGLVRSVSEVIPTFIYRWGLLSMQFSLSAAIGIFQSVIGMILLLGGNWLAKRLGSNGFW
ncbi:MAG: ABC transporter permease subunit [Defluviitaleaceae bacterium]|nr:ABC transporter permease subunit [Defluviitaleaceae bacterium]